MRSLVNMRKRNKSGVKIRSRCRVCGRYRYLVFLRPSVTYPSKWMCQDESDCVSHYKHQVSLIR